MMPGILARSASAILIVAFHLVPAVFAQQPERDGAAALSQRAADRMRALQEEADRLARQARTLLGDLRSLELARQMKNEEYAEIAARAENAARALASTTEQVSRLEREDLAEQPEIAARLVTLYKLGHGRYMRMLLSVSDVRSLGQAARMVASVADRDRDRIATHQRRLGDLKAARTSLQAQVKTLAAERAEADRARVAASQALERRNALITSIDAARDLNAQLASELQSSQQKLQAALRGTGAGASPVEPALPIRPFRGELDWPVTGTVRQAFGRSAAGRPSNGIEIAADEGAAVTAIHGATVAFADSFSGFGKLVILDHGSQVFSLYGNLLDIAVTQGAHVAAGARIGSAGPSQTSVVSAGTGTLYFEVRVDDRPVDPLQWLKRK